MPSLDCRLRATAAIYHALLILIFSVQLKLIKIGGRVVSHARRIIFQLAEVAVFRDLFAAILERVRGLSLVPG